MKILLLSDLNSIHTKKWVAAIAQNKIELMVFGLTPPDDDFYSDLKHVKIAFANQGNLRYRSMLSKLAYLSQSNILKKCYDNFKPDIVHAHYASSYGLLGSFLKHKPFLISMWGTDIFDFPKKSIFNRFILKRNLKKADYLFSTSQTMADEARQYTNKSIDIVPFGVDILHFSPQENTKDADTIVLGIVKTLELNYGINFLIEAFHILIKERKDSRLKLIIAGAGSQEVELKKMVDEFGLNSHVQFLGYITHQKVVNVFRQMDIAVISSLEESFGVSAVEAGACGLPVVATRVGGLPEVVIDQKTGLLCQPANPRDMAVKLNTLIMDSTLRKTLGMNARENVARYYDWSQNAMLMIDHYKNIFSNKS